MNKDTTGKKRQGAVIAEKLFKNSHIKDFDQDQLTGKARLDALDKLSAQELAKLLLEEDLPSQAFILAHVDARKSFETLEILPVSIRSKILGAISKLSPTDPVALTELNFRLEKKLQELTL